MKQLHLTVSALIVCVLAGTSVAGAAGLEYYGIEGTIGSDLSVSNKIVLQFSEPVGHLDYTLPYSISNLTYESNFPFAECNAADSLQGSTISCDFTGMSSSRNKLTLMFDTSNMITPRGGVYCFSADYGISVPVDRAFALIRLPENGILSEQVANQSFFPQDGNIASDGRVIMVYWNQENLTHDSSMEYSVLFSMPSSGDGFFSVLVIGIVAIIIAAIIAYVAYLKLVSRGPGASEVLGSVLNKDENTIVSILNRHGGKAGQKVLVRESDFSKAKVSRLVKSLRGRGVVDTEPISGRENRVMLKTPKAQQEGEDNQD